MSNVSLMLRPDGRFEIVPRSGAIMISSEGILGPYKLQGGSVYPSIPGLPRGTWKTLRSGIAGHVSHSGQLLE